MEGIWFGALGEVHAQTERPEAAREALARGEALLRAVGDTFELAKLLCSRARLELAEGRADDARPILASVDLLVADLKATPDSELGRLVATTRRDLGTGLA